MSRLEIRSELSHLKGLRYERAMLIDYNQATLEDVLPGLFYVVRKGRLRAKGQWNRRTAQQVSAELSEKEDLFPGFGGTTGQKILEEWLKSGVLRLDNRKGSDKVMSIKPLHLMTYRIDLPSYWSALRSIPEFVAAILHHDPAAGPDWHDRREPFALQSSDNLFWKSFGGGMVNDSALHIPDRDRYDDDHELDIESLLAVRVSEGFTTPSEITTRAPSKGGIPGFEPLCPSQARVFREDFSLFLRAYSPPAVPVRVLGDYVMCLLALNLTTYTLCHIAASNHLYEYGEFLTDRHSICDPRVWEPGIYADVTGGKVLKSLELARESYGRHHRWMLRQLRTMIGFRLLDLYLRSRTDIKELRNLKDLRGIEFLKTLSQARNRSSGDVFNAAQAGAAYDLSRLRLSQPGQQWQDDLAYLADDQSMPPLDRLVELLATTQEKLRTNLLSFFHSCARRNLDSGILSGHSTRREENHYTLGLRLQEALVQLLVLKPSSSPTLQPLNVYDFVEQLKTRYGIWIHEPPKGLDQSYEARQAAQANFAALKEQLRQLGFFRGVTDARRMQRLRARYVPIGDTCELERGASDEPVD